MNEDESRVVQSSDLGEAFGTLSDPTRIAILQALWGFEDHEASFSDLRKAVGMRDSGKFNYHVNQFEGRFVERTEEGYALRRAGLQLVGAILAGTYSKSEAIGPVAVGAACQFCGDDLEFRYVEEAVKIDCRSCGNVSDFPVPPGIFVGYGERELPAVSEQYAWSEIERVARGFCRICDGRLDSRLVTAAETAGPETDPPVELEDVPMVVDDCRRCDHRMATNLGMRLVSHPEVVAFYHDHGVDYRKLPIWELMLAEEGGAILDRDPIRATVTYEAGDEQLTLTVEDPDTVVATERRER